MRERCVVLLAAVLWLMPSGGGAARAQGTVPVGWCTSLENLATARAAGFDYVELGTTEIAGLSDNDFAQALADVERIGLPTPVTNLFLPGSLKVTGPDVDAAAQMAYVTRAFDRLQRLGVTVLVFGSGGARRVPDGFPMDKAFDQLVDFGRRIAPEAQRRGITVTIEPLRRQETNIINSAAEGLRLVNAIGHPGFQLMIDFYHLASEREDPSIVLKAGTHLRHLHTANPEGRVFPVAWDEYDYDPFFAALRQAGYSGRISVEGSSKDVPGDAPKSIALLKAAFRKP
jgi:D-psicose/D-tagatose/L-ribulose 3-epimerase